MKLFFGVILSVLLVYFVLLLIPGYPPVDEIPFYQDPGIHTIGTFKMEGIKGKHCDPYGKEFGQKNTIWIFEVAGLRIAHWGDNAPINDTILQALENIDILLVPIDDTFHILKEEELKEPKVIAHDFPTNN